MFFTTQFHSSPPIHLPPAHISPNIISTNARSSVQNCRFTDKFNTKAGNTLTFSLDFLGNMELILFHRWCKIAVIRRRKQIAQFIIQPESRNEINIKHRKVYYDKMSTNDTNLYFADKCKLNKHSSASFL